uniref:Uncharacterized protein n=1 Tax=Myoviridae sp. ctCo31 TaxID=2825053 RepID=A0A8S5UMW4_9CAUD|nr:MAG TPA: hypothetical protein [Myoviridae sp. ctCo31]
MIIDVLSLLFLKYCIKSICYFTITQITFKRLMFYVFVININIKLFLEQF